MLVITSSAGLAGRRKGAALVITVLAAALLATIVVGSLTVALSDQRAAAASIDLGQARNKLSLMLGSYRSQLGLDPLFYFHHVDVNERPRLCAADNTVVQPGESWPAHCGVSWTYTDPVASSPITIVPTTRIDGMLEVEPPTPQRNTLRINLVARAEQTVVAQTVELTQAGSDRWTVVSETPIALSSIYKNAPPADGEKIYTAAGLDSAGVTLTDSLVAAEDGVVAQTVGNRYFTAEPQVTVIDEETAQTITQEQIRTIVPARRALTSARSQTEAIAAAACLEGGGPAGTMASATFIAPRNVDGSNVSSLCLYAGQQIRDTNATLHCIPTSATVAGCVSGSVTSYLIVPIQTGGETRLRVFAATAANGADSADWASSAPIIAAGAHPGDLSFWTIDLGTYRLPVSGVVVADRDVQISICQGFATGGCAATLSGDPIGTGTPFTVIAGSSAAPRSIYIGGPINGGGGVGAIAFDQVRIPFWARPAGGDVEIDVAALAFGLLTPGPGVLAWPETVSSAGTLTVVGSVTASGVTLADTTQFTSVQVDGNGGGQLAHWPSFDGVWQQHRVSNAAPVDLCGGGDPQCSTWLGIP